MCRKQYFIEQMSANFNEISLYNVHLMYHCDVPSINCFTLPVFQNQLQLTV